MSSFTRRIERQVVPSQKVHRTGPYDSNGNRTLRVNPPRAKFYQGRGDRLGVKNPKDACLLANLARHQRRTQATAPRP